MAGHDTVAVAMSNRGDKVEQKSGHSVDSNEEMGDMRKLWWS